MHIIEKKLKKAELAYGKEKSASNALALFACYILAEKTLESDGIYYSKAYHVAVEAHYDDPLDTRIISAMLYVNVLLDNIDTAAEIVSQLEAHSQFLGKNFPLFQGQSLYFSTIIQSQTEKLKGAKKSLRNLEALYEKTQLPELSALIGSAYRLAADDAAMCAEMYCDAMRKGLKSVYFLIDVYDVLVTEEIYSNEMNELASRIIPWALGRNLHVDAIIARLEKRTLIRVLFSLSARHLAKIYEAYGHSGAFQCLCQKLIFEGDTGERALSYYIKALHNNLKLRGLEQISVRAAYQNDYYGLPTAIAEQALINSKDYDLGLLAFLHGIILSRHEEEMEEAAENAAEFGEWAYLKGLRGKDFNILYKVLFELNPNDQRFAETVFDELFKYELEFGANPPKYVCVYEYPKRGIAMSRVDSNVAYVNSITPSFNCYFLGEDSDVISVSGYKTTKTLAVDEAEKAPLYEALYGRGMQSPELIIALALEYISLPELDKGKLDILQKASNLEEISDDLKNEICGRLAEHYSGLEHYSSASYYYRIIGESGIKPGEARGALKAFIATGRFYDAISIISARRAELSDEDVFDAVKVLYELSDSPEMAALCYNLIMDGFCSKEVLSVLIKNFRGTPDEWLTIANKIDTLGFDVVQLYEKIIVDGIFAGRIGNDCNEAFAKLYYLDKKHPVIPKYVYFCCYEIIRNGKIIPEEISDILSEIRTEDDTDSILCAALAINYIRTGRQDKAQCISEAASEFEEIGIVFPELKQYQDKSFISSYIEKNTPFVYYKTARKTVYFCYKTEDMEAFTKKKMKYFRFGMFFTNVHLFYDEKITYYFEEDNGYKTDTQTYTKTQMRLIEQFNDPYYTVNNAVIYEHMMKFDMLEELIEDKLETEEQFPIIVL